MKFDFMDSITSSLNTPYKDFCEEYIRLAELIIQFEQDQMEKIDKAEKDEITRLHMGESTKLSYLGEDGIKKHYLIIKARIIRETMEQNSGVKQVYDTLNKYVLQHNVERGKMGLTMKNGKMLTPIELIENYEIVVQQVANFNIQSSTYNKK